MSIRARGVSNFDFKKSNRKCSVTGRDFETGEEYVSALMQSEDELLRIDFGMDHWNEPPQECIGWWKSRVPDLDKGRVYWAPRNVLLAYFEHLIEQPGSDDIQYVMGLLLVRKRILRLVDSVAGEAGQWIVLNDANQKKNYELTVPDLTPEQTSAIQSELEQKLFTDHRQLDVDEDGDES